MPSTIYGCNPDKLVTEAKYRKLVSSNPKLKPRPDLILKSPSLKSKNKDHISSNNPTLAHKSSRWMSEIFKSLNKEKMIDGHESFKPSLNNSNMLEVQKI